MPRLTSKNNIEAIKSYFTDEQVIRAIANYSGMDFDTLIGGEYKILLEPIAYADKQELEEAIIRRHYASSIEDEENQVDQGAAAAGGLSQGMRPEANRRKPALRP